ncbi:hypothetical protein [Streptomyces sp. NBC_01187]|uniref:hypothetical protein n=1 Tax=Streptomyces sp. NBC_01187 TaxID=2903766 RepID=UPI00386A1452|nr:hypothetical protein OG220_31830 [Streptomyces sp. NBC_01187]
MRSHPPLRPLPCTGRITPVQAVLRIVTAAGLAVNAQVHARLADQYDVVTESISQGTLFRLEAALAALAALLVLVWRSRPADTFALAVSLGGLALLLIYRYFDIGVLGPFPDMYEPLWFTDKTVIAVAQAVSALTALILLVWVRGRGRSGAERGMEHV